jgi:hypothetical protein
MVATRTGLKRKTPKPKPKPKPKSTPTTKTGIKRKAVKPKPPPKPVSRPTTKTGIKRKPNVPLVEKSAKPKKAEPKKAKPKKAEPPVSAVKERALTPAIKKVAREIRELIQSAIDLASAKVLDLRPDADSDGKFNKKQMSEIKNTGPLFHMFEKISKILVHPDDLEFSNEAKTVIPKMRKILDIAEPNIKSVALKNPEKLKKMLSILKKLMDNFKAGKQKPLKEPRIPLRERVTIPKPPAKQKKAILVNINRKLAKARREGDTKQIALLEKTLVNQFKS